MKRCMDFQLLFLKRIVAALTHQRQQERNKMLVPWQGWLLRTTCRTGMIGSSRAKLIAGLLEEEVKASTRMLPKRRSWTHAQATG